MADVLTYPRGQIALGAGDLIDVINIKYDHSNGMKQIHTIRRKGAGVSPGVEETTVAFDMVISEEGAERDYFKLIKKGTISQLRLKIPGETITVNGAFSKRSIEMPLDDAIKKNVEFVGHTAD